MRVTRIIIDLLWLYEINGYDVTELLSDYPLRSQTLLQVTLGMLRRTINIKFIDGILISYSDSKHLS